jgi:hypothetical protein
VRIRRPSDAIFVASFHQCNPNPPRTLVPPSVTCCQDVLFCPPHAPASMRCSAIATLLIQLFVAPCIQALGVRLSHYSSHPADIGVANRFCYPCMSIPVQTVLHGRPCLTREYLYPFTAHTNLSPSPVFLRIRTRNGTSSSTRTVGQDPLTKIIKHAFHNCQPLQTGLLWDLWIRKLEMSWRM